MGDDSFHLLYRSFLKRAPTENKTDTPNNVWAMCRAVEHRDSQHWYDRNRYGELYKQLEARLALLEGKP